MDFLSLAEKEKEKRSTVLGLIWPETAHDRRKRARVGLQCRVYIEGPGDFEKLVKSPPHYLFESLTNADRPSTFFFFTTRDPRRWTATGRASASLYLPEWATARDLAWLTLNLTLNNHFPSTNFKVLGFILSAHGDSAINGQHEVFPVILWVLA
jgi:hypothetical protein